MQTILLPPGTVSRREVCATKALLIGAELLGVVVSIEIGKVRMGMAQLLLEYEVKTGSWQNLFKELEAIARVTPKDVQRVAKAAFTAENRTVGRLLPKEG